MYSSQAVLPKNLGCFCDRLQEQFGLGVLLFLQTDLCLDASGTMTEN